MNTLLDLDNVDAFYGSAHILHGLSLQVNAGERVALIGRNGVGKTTVVNTLLGLAQLRGDARPRFGSYLARRLVRIGSDADVRRVLAHPELGRVPGQVLQGADRRGVEQVGPAGRRPRRRSASAARSPPCTATC